MADYPPRLTAEQTGFLLDSIKEWSATHGLTVRPPQSFTDADPKGSLVTTAPVTLFPSLFPRTCFTDASIVQILFNELYAKIAQDEEWLGRICIELAKIDDFIAKLWEVHESVKAEGYIQPLTLGIFRSDYMVHLPPGNNTPRIRQVEFNTIASSFGGLSSRVSALHGHLLSIGAYPDATADFMDSALLPVNDSIEKISAAIVEAHAAYGPSKTGHARCILFIVQHAERNIFDQKHIEYAVSAACDARVFRLPFAEILQHTRIDPADPHRALIYTPPAFPKRQHEVTTTYFRAGYSPAEYTSPESWRARLQVERSAAIKCPSILTHLAGSKKVQQVLAAPGAGEVERFLTSPGTAKHVTDTFASMYPLDSSEAGREGKRLALDERECRRFVLKPQREGGGNNIYRDKIPRFLRGIDEAKWPAYVLMEMIEPPAQRNVILRNGETQEGGVICELGLYGTCLWRHGSGKEDEGNITDSHEAGYLLRTKGDASEEGGVAAGFGSVDSCVLV